MNTTKYEFMKEIMKINDPKLGMACVNLVQSVPEYFWTIPASSTGKYHPECDLGDGGLVRHSIMVATAADELVTSEVFVEDTPLNHDIARVAGLFHDVLKSGEVDDEGNYSAHTEFNHPLLAAKWIRSLLTFEGIDETIVDEICLAIESHMGKWNTSKYSDAVLPVPSSPMEKLVHTADYVASRKWVKGLW